MAMPARKASAPADLGADTAIREDLQQQRVRLPTVDDVRAPDTLRQGIETTLLEEVPELKRVADVTDHGSGDNPFYS